MKNNSGTIRHDKSLGLPSEISAETIPTILDNWKESEGSLDVSQVTEADFLSIQFIATIEQFSNESGNLNVVGRLQEPIVQSLLNLGLNPSST